MTSEDWLHISTDCESSRHFYQEVVDSNNFKMQVVARTSLVTESERTVAKVSCYKYGEERSRNTETKSQSSLKHNTEPESIFITKLLKIFVMIRLWL
ncbi:hypothetical protein NPIL_576141 [Nephila pilipes]|uniref:Uncharacterized protein n=1 Tax=Nephila pilipes TaxID=299642 RepID=A0A8X6TGN4_NEPPI|nr:hypothetical protein NPIL_576141 [Nephila pilipes]